MSKPLRSLSGLIDFDCAARWGSFKQAAQELHKTPAAISQQVKHLEEQVGFALFIRHPRHITLTEKGGELAISVGRMLTELRNKIEALQSGDEENVLHISTTHSFAIKWLVPRMHRFTKLYPDLDIKLDSNDRPVNLDDASTDVAIRYGEVDESDPAFLFRERLVAVYSPSLLPSGQEAIGLGDLHKYPLLYEKATEAWLNFLKENKGAKGKFNFSRSYSHYGVLTQAAVAGQGVALVAYGIAYDDIKHGALKMVAGRSPRFSKGYRFLVNPNKEKMQKIQRFRAWIVAEMAEMRKG